MIVETFVDGHYEQFQLTEKVETIDEIAQLISYNKRVPKETICFVYNGDVIDPLLSLNDLSLKETSKLRYFISHPTLEINDIHPQEGYTSGGTHVTLQGNFPESNGRYIVKFGTLEVVGQYIDANTIIAITPPHSPGPVSVFIKLNQNGRFIEGKTLFSYVNHVIGSKEIEVQCLDKMSHQMTSQRFASGSNGV
ncbi:IPT/TIG domain containing protein [Entamoeba histolytica HM-1:IMSS-B]|uniref:IPT/TIG domain-containing protein n=6 Tax=Entamoeba histolytica TaxID=5759 RepID=C4LUB4_ENTH1|nr:hypothetical protein EHI_110670 [Entamoeba histolytica HM-1:IMSS]EMD45085.1 IPT/TIG domain containing protein [Entamoeba histolytica KU27]EMH72049.1 IPT/TIG domain containing protein [Entamoeba histolytica HM-1:IMSS-B]EMS17904.1 IPT/TIG domain containing protein [Entamoeba histolytica HM-3:IMSS]ENY63719.1 IPT/TIG domain containing protein [Entamoeba histolytica HM-1:IMSS-A]GAT92196.1 hypothetical protein CL6EHI_110670 [Entamoeba histolytica]|eukprot:XP_654265.1 hypothetical protein EHI_110670 [Entamoeba histolytica HM-1:IMSS]